MSENIHIRAEFIVEKDKVEQFKKLIREMSNVVETIETKHISLSILY
ncbi:MAG: hypothetical protein P0116_08145 [Candidatus Nitrosocosmicus sp.]|nr:hypothetical protein [Candidatus Nitrosocosmicus sp.]